MKKFIFSIAIFLTANVLFAQKNVGIGNSSPVTKLDVSGALALREGLPLTLSNGGARNGANDTIKLSYITGTTDIASYYHITGPTAAFSVYGIVPTTNADGQILTLINNTGYTMTVVNTGSASAGDSIYTQIGSNITDNAAVGVGSSVTLQYSKNAGGTGNPGWIVLSTQNFRVTNLQGNPVSTTTPGTSDVLQWNGTSWVPSSVAGPSGPAGPAGATGPSGPSGSAGSAGAAGATGPSGPSGSTGAAGTAGATGPSGPSGSAGSAGAAGATGPSGPSGSTGAAGAAGAAGPSGPSGSAGSAGAAGATGPSGPSGSTGAAGTAGAAGPSGPSGSAGSAGAAGATGPSGPSGSTGAAGAAGAAGPSGPSGSAGSAGAAGATGPSGPSGSTGAAGAAGAAGPSGPSGSAGSAGAAGATGPSGPSGSTGAAGAAGAAGPSGPSGSTGAAGAAGSTGPSGPSGSAGSAGAAGATGPSGPSGATGSSGPSGPSGLLASGTATGVTPYWNGTTWVVSSTNIYNDGANVGIGTASPTTLLSNTATNIVGSDGYGLTSASLGWAVNANSGYSIGIYNGNTGTSAQGLAVKIAGTAITNRLLDLSVGSTQGTAGTSVMVVTGSGTVGIGVTSPAQTLDVNGAIHMGSTSTPSTGTVRWNSTLNDFEGYDGVRWISLTGLQDRTLIYTKD